MTFWNKVQSGVSRAAAEAEKQTKVTRINLQIGEVQSAIRRKQQELGEAALKLVRSQTAPSS
jgi:Zn finger protein HypA/HybF involved in hydrogenase expression